MRINVLKPGLLVALSVRIEGGVSYRRIEVDPEHDDGEGGRIGKWETEKYIPDAKAYELATQTRSKARALVAEVCSPSSFGMLCPLSEEKALREAVTNARTVAQAFNATSTGPTVKVFVLVGRIAQDDAEAARAIGSEVRALLNDMAQGVKDIDAEAIREAATKAKALGQMLSEDVSDKVEAAIKEARSAAREIVRRVEKAGERGADVIKAIKLRALEDARMAFLDFEEGAQGEAVKPEGRALDLDSTPADAAPAMSAGPAPLFEV